MSARARPADPDDWGAGSQLAMQSADDGGGFVRQGLAAQAAGLFGVVQAGNTRSFVCGVGGDHSVDFVTLDRLGQGGKFLAAQIRRHLHRQRHVTAVCLGQFVLCRFQPAEQTSQRRPVLQCPEPRRVGRGHVHRDVAGEVVHLPQARLIIVQRVLHWRIPVFADIDAQHTLVVTPGQGGQEMVHAEIVEAHAVDQGVRLGQAEHPRTRIAALGSWRHGAYLQETKSEARKTVHAVSVLVQTGCQTHGIREVQSHHPGG